MLESHNRHKTYRLAPAAVSALVARLRRCRWRPACAAFLLLSACQIPLREPVSEISEPLAACTAFFTAVDSMIDDKGVARSFPHRISGFPYLRTTRVLASFRDDVAGDAARATWLAHLAAADGKARSSELAQLRSEERRQLMPASADMASRMGLSSDAETETVLEHCRALLLARDGSDPARMAQLRKAVVPDDEYSTVQRIAGLYPFTSLGVKAGVARWHDDVRRVYAGKGTEVSPPGQRRRYGPAPGNELEKAGPLFRDLLDLPRPQAAQLEALYRQHAPVWDVDTASAADIPGAPVWKAYDGTPGVNTEDPVVYRYTSITRFRGRPRLQLNYLVWFDERPVSGPLDMLAGRLDGVIWRVTLNDSGMPMVYDSVHACGCYHLLFPVGDVTVRPGAQTLAEPPMVPLTLQEPTVGTRVHLRLSAGAHYLEGVTHAIPDGATIAYRFADRAALYTTPVVGGGFRSLFRPDGLISGTERGERWFLWPTGVRSPGAMRERGRRATAFIGRRHFDDAFLLDELLQ